MQIQVVQNRIQWHTFCKKIFGFHNSTGFLRQLQTFQGISCTSGPVRKNIVAPQNIFEVFYYNRFRRLLSMLLKLAVDAF
jgi:hypothetical protein